MKQNEKTGHAERSEAFLSLQPNYSTQRQRCFTAVSMTCVYKPFNSGAS
jgi:hypothetical protein